MLPAGPDQGVQVLPRASPFLVDAGRWGRLAHGETHLFQLCKCWWRQGAGDDAVLEQFLRIRSSLARQVFPAREKPLAKPPEAMLTRVQVARGGQRFHDVVRNEEAHQDE